MRRELMLAAAKSALPSFDKEQLGSHSYGTEKRTGKETGTTIVVFRGGHKDGEQFLVCAADKKVSYGGHGIASQQFRKIFQLSDTSLLLGSGGVGSIQELLNLVRSQCEEWQEMHGMHISIAGQAHLLVQWCNIFRRFFEGYHFSFGSIIAGLNADGSLQMYNVDDDGSRLEIKNYFAGGSGGDHATTVLDMLWEEKYRNGMDVGVAVDLAVQAVYFAALRDGWSSDLRIAVPSISIIHPEHGIVKLPKDAVDTIVEEFLARHEGELKREIAELRLVGDLKPRRRRKKPKGRKK